LVHCVAARVLLHWVRQGQPALAALLARMRSSMR
jgi:hypothetical protein